MSVICTLIRIPEQQLQTAVTDTDSAEAIFIALNGGEDGDTDPSFPWTDIDGSFDIIHFILDPARRLSSMGEPTNGLGGRLVYGTHAQPEGWADFYEDYGVEGYSTSDEVRALVAEMSTIDFEIALSQVSLELTKPRAVYAGDAEYAREYYSVIRQFYEAAASENQAVVTFVQ